MTTRTRTTTGFAAKVLTALLAVLALVAGVMVFAAPAANADPEDKVWVCHADANNGNGNLNLGHNGTGGENKNGFNLILISRNAWDAAHNPTDGVHDNDWLATADQITAQTCGDIYKDTVKASAGTTICVGTTLTPVAVEGNGVQIGPQATPVTDQQRGDALAADQPSADTNLATALAGFPGYTEPVDGLCPAPTPQTVKADSTMYICYRDARVTVTGTGAGVLVDPPLTAEKVAAAKAADQPSADAARDAQLAGYPGYTVTTVDGVCGGGGSSTVLVETPAPAVETPAAVLPATVEPVATAPVQPATVPTPTKAVLPGTVPAGDGSTVPTVPLVLLGLLVVGAAGVTATATRLATRR